MTAFVWLNGEILPTDDARISPTDRGFLLGDGLFETLRVTGGTSPHATRHLARLTRGCEILGFSPPDTKILEKAITDLLAVNALTEGVLRLTVTRGSGSRGVIPPTPLRPTALLQTSGVVPALARPVRVDIARYRRDGSCPLSRVKTLAFLPSIMSRIEALKAGWDDALLLGQGEAIAEASAANLLILSKDRGLLTPPLADGALPGTSRARLLEAGLCKECSIYPQDLEDVTGAWLVNALSLTPVKEIKGYTLPACAEIERKLLAFLFAL